MSIERIQSDDPRLTAYVLNELDAAERADVEAAIGRSPEARTAVAELRDTIDLVQTALGHELAAPLTDQQRLAIAAAADETPANGRSVPSVPSPAVARRPFRGRYVVVATCVSVAAAVAVVLAVPAFRDQEQSSAEHFRDAASSSPRGEELAEARRQAVVNSERSRMAMLEAGARDEREKLRAEYDRSGPVSGPQPVDSLSSTPSHLSSAITSQAGGISESLSQVQQPGGGYGGYGPSAQQGGQGQPAGHRGWTAGGATGDTGLGLPQNSPLGGSGSGGANPGGRPASFAGGYPAPVAGATPVSSGALQLGEKQVFEGSRSESREVHLAKEAAPVATLTASSPALADSASPQATPLEGFAREPSAETLRLGFRESGFHGAGEAYNPIIENEFVTPTGQAALSTFSIDVDTASYSNVRRFLTHGQFPPPDAVRVEELLNYFRYDYPQPEGNSPFSVTTEIGVCPWNADHRLARIGLKGREIAKEQRPPSNLVFLVDVSGSMRDENKLPLVQQGLEMLVGEMTEDDRVAIVTYAGDAGLKLPSTSGDRRDDILSVIRGLSAGGSTNGEAGIHLAYTQAIQYLINDGTNRVILCTDGDFNVGVSDDNELVRLIQDKARESRVFLSIFGFGMGNLKDAKLEQLANKGNGQYAYVDSPREARKVFVEEMAGSLYTIAKDVKIQVEFNPAHVGAYRLIGYENRVLANRDFNDDTKDAGEIGAGHTVTALYEVIPADKFRPAAGEPLKYQPQPNGEVAAAAKADASPESFTVKLRFKLPNEDASTLVEFPVLDRSERSASPSRDFDWAASVAAFGLILRNSQHKGQADLELVRELALGARGADESGLRREFIDLVYTAKRLQAQQRGEPVPAPEALPEEQAEAKAAVDGKYRTLLKRVHAPQDFQSYGAYNDFGYWGGTSYAGEQDLPQGHWVYVYPHWYIWGETGTRQNP